MLSEPCLVFIICNMRRYQGTDSGDNPLYNDGNELTSGSDDEDVHVAKMGYAASLHRGLDGFANLCIGVSFMGLTSELLFTYNFSLIEGGPVVLFWGFLFGFAVNVVVAMVLGEMASAYPSSGTLFYWSNQLCPTEDAFAWSYSCGYFFFVGLVGGIAAWALGSAQFISSALVISGYSPIPIGYEILLSIVMIVVWGLLNFIRIDYIGIINTSGAVINFVAIIVVSILLLSLSKQLNSPKFVFTDYYNGTGFGYAFYVILLGVSTISYNFSGYESCARMSEESQDARKSVPLGIVYAVVASGCFGIILILALLFATPNLTDAINGTPTIDTGNAALNVFVVVFGPTLAAIFAWIFISFNFIVGINNVTACSRTCYALARDKLLPFSDWLYQTDPDNQSPINAVIALSGLSVLLCLLGLTPMTSVFYCFIGFNVFSSQVSYGIPILVKLIYHDTLDFHPGPFNLGGWSYVMGVISCIWLFSTAIVFLLPTQYPITVQNMNWVFVLVIAVTIIGVLNWFLYAKNIYKGPQRFSVKISRTTARTVSQSEKRSLVSSKHIISDDA